MTPVEERVAFAGNRTGGRLSPDGLLEFRVRFAKEASAREFLDWRTDPVTLRFLGALRAMAVNPPPASVNRDSVELQFGVTSGLNIAVSLIDDPTSLFPDLFSQLDIMPTPGQDPDGGDGAYSVAPDACP